MYNRSGLGINLQSGSFAAISPSDVTTYPPSTLYVGVTGKVRVWGVGGSAGGTVTFDFVPAGTFMPILVTKVVSATTAGSLIILQ